MQPCRRAAVLRAYEVPRRRWVISSCIAWTIVSVLDTWRIYALSSSRWLLAGGLVLASSAVLVVIFWLGLRHYRPQSWRWAIAGIVGYALSAVVVVVQSALIRASLPY